MIALAALYDPLPRSDDAACLRASQPHTYHSLITTMGTPPPPLHCPCMRTFQDTFTVPVHSAAGLHIVSRRSSPCAAAHLRAAGDSYQPQKLSSAPAGTQA